VNSVIVNSFPSKCNPVGVCECDGQFAENGTGCNVYIASGVDVFCIKVRPLHSRYRPQFVNAFSCMTGALGTNKVKLGLEFLHEDYR